MYAIKTKHFEKRVVLEAINTLLHNNHRYKLNKAEPYWQKARNGYYALRGMRFTDAEVLKIKTYCAAKGLTVSTTASKAALNKPEATACYTLTVK